MPTWGSSHQFLTNNLSKSNMCVPSLQRWRPVSLLAIKNTLYCLTLTPMTFQYLTCKKINNRKLPLIAPHYCSSFVHAHVGKNSEGNQWMSVSCSTCGDLCNEIPLIKIHQGVCYLRSQIIARETRTIISFSMLRCPCLPQISNI